MVSCVFNISNAKFRICSEFKKAEQQPSLLENKANTEVPKLHSLKWPLATLMSRCDDTPRVHHSPHQDKD